MNWVDILFLLLLFAGLAIGFFQGTIKLIVAIVAFYISIVLASLYFQTLGNFFRIRFNSTLEVGQITAFALILLVSFILLTIAGLYTFRYARFPASLDFLDRMAGTVFGLVLGALFIGMMAILLRNLFSNNLGTVSSLPFVGMFQNGVRGSTLLSYFADYVLPLIYNVARPVLPSETNIIFRHGKWLSVNKH